jgi:hypothetical protein
MKGAGITLLIVAVILMFIHIILGVNSNYQYTSKIGSYWSLADRSSTLAAKSEYIGKFIDAIMAANHSRNNSVLMPTMENSFDYNLIAIKTLESRLMKIQTMDENSFAYQTAMQQITGQEMGEAENMLNIFRGCWFLSNFPLCWGWYVWLFAIVYIILWVVGAVLWYQSNN